MDANSIATRAKSVLLTPRKEWQTIAAEPATIGGLFTGYILIMAAIPAVVRFLSYSVIGVSVPILGTYRFGVGAALTNAVITYVLSLIGVYVIALIADALAPTFGAQRNQVQALKSVAYAYTASWVISIIGIIPGLTLLAALVGGIYSIYLLRLGLPVTMKCSDDKAVGYTALTIVAGVVVAVVLGLVLRSVGGFGTGVGRGLTRYSAQVPGTSGNFTPGSAGAGLQAFANRLADASKQVAAAQRSGGPSAQANAVGQFAAAALGGGGNVESLPPDRIKTFVPESLGGLPRTQLTVERSNALGVQVSKASASYGNGAGQDLDLEITDSGSLRGLVGVATGWGGVEQDRESATGYEKTYSTGGQLVHEQWDNQGHRGTYGVVVGERFSVQVSGTATNIDQLKQAVATINLSGLQALKNSGVQSH